MRFERMIRLTMLAGAALALPGMTVAAPAGMGQSAPQSPEDYQWIDQADALWDAIGDAPPDFAFAFEGREPWAWQTTDGYTIIVEDAGTGGIRSYYFSPGASGPFLAVEPGMSFAYVRGRLAMVYDADGEAAPRAEFGDYDDAAGSLYARAVRLREALAGRDYRPVDTDAWIDTSPYLLSFIQVWDSGRSRYSGWTRYHDRGDAAAWRRRFEAEQRRRRGDAERFRHWREGGFQGPPPGRFHPPGRGSHQPGQPGTGRPPQPGWGWSRRPDGGRPPQPGQPVRPGAPGTSPPPRPGMPIAEPGGASGPVRPPMTRPWAGGPDGPRSPGWRRARPDLPVSPGAEPGAGNPPDSGSRPPRPGTGTGWQRPTPPPPVVAPPATTPSPAPVPPPAAVENPPVPPRWSRPPRPEGGWNRPRPPVAGDGAMPAPPRPPRPEGGWQRPTPPAPGSAPPPRPSYTPPPAPRPAPPPREPKISSEEPAPS